ncbi:MAG: hypothetical protein HW405_132 [Candidatus Berkelbacteria bacterium]|nr:hypothetical protein [Candidatus Berkelbacteria bacterium]
MPFCQFTGCQVTVSTKEELCPAHQQELIAKASKHLSPEYSQFLVEHINGCVTHDVADFLGIKAETIDRFLTWNFGELTYAGPLYFIDRRQLIRVLLNVEGFRKFEKGLAKLEDAHEEREARKPKLIIQDAVKDEEETTRYSRRRLQGISSENLNARDIEVLTGISGENIRRWILTGIIPFTPVPLGDRGKTMRLVTMANLIKFAQESLRDPRFRRFHANLLAFLRAHDVLPQVTTPAQILQDESAQNEIREESTVHIPHLSNRKRRGGRDEDEYTSWDISCLFHGGVSDTTVQKWIRQGLMQFREIPFGNQSRKMKVVKKADLIAFVQGCFGNWRFVRHGECFTKFLQQHAPKEEVQT